MGIHLFGALYVSWSVGYYFCFVIVTSLIENYTHVTDMLAEVVVLLTCVLRDVCMFQYSYNYWELSFSLFSSLFLDKFGVSKP